MIVRPNKLNGWVFVDIVGRDIGGGSPDAQRCRRFLPPDISIGWSPRCQSAGLSDIAIPARRLVLVSLLLTAHLWQAGSYPDGDAVLLFGLVVVSGCFIWWATTSVAATVVWFYRTRGIAVEEEWLLKLIHIDQQVPSAANRADLFEGCHAWWPCVRPTGGLSANTSGC